MTVISQSHLILLSASVAFAYLAKPLLRLLHNRYILKHVPGPSSSSFIWGEEYKLYFNSPGRWWIEWHAQYGKVVKFTGAFWNQQLSITDSKAISFILGENAFKFPKADGVRAWLKATKGEGLVWTEDRASHEHQKRTLSPAFSKQTVLKLMPMFYETSSKLVNRWLEIVDRSPSDEAVIDATFWAGRFALDTLSRAAFSYDLTSLNGEPNGLADALDGLTNNENRLSSFYMRALFWIFPSILMIGKKGEMIRLTKTELGKIASKMWTDHKASGESDSKNLMSMMLAADPNMSEDRALDQMRTLISAGYETVSSTISWILYEIASNPEIQHKVREEVLSAPPTADPLGPNYTFLDAVLKETYRLHPPILENHHQAGETIAVPLEQPLPETSEAQFVIPKGTILAIPVNVIQLDTSVWGPDAHTFRPQRWIERESAGIRHPRELLAFGEGPRHCIGRQFARAEINVLVLTLIKAFRFSCPQNIEPFQSFVIRPRVAGHGASSLPLTVKKI